MESRDIALVAVLVVIVGGGFTVLYASGAFGTLNQQGQVPPGTEICDATITLGGMVHDIEGGGHNVDSWSFNKSITNCHPKGALEASIAPPEANGAALAVFLPGQVTIETTLEDANHHSWGSHNFDVHTGALILGDPNGVNKPFSENFQFNKLPHGSYKLLVTYSWIEDGHTVTSYQFNV